MAACAPVVRLDPVQVLLVAVGELRVQHRAHQHVLGRVAHPGRRDGRVEPARGTRRARESCTITVPRQVQRWPPVPKPENSAPSTARSRSALGVTTSGFLPPSSRHAVCRCRPVRAPISRPTADEPVKPTLSMKPASRAGVQPGEGRRAVGVHDVQHPVRQPAAADEQLVEGRRDSPRSTRPASRPPCCRPAGRARCTRTARPPGSCPAVIIATVPTGLRKVNSCLSGISLGTVWPYRRRPSPRKKSQVSTISRTSPSASAYGLPISAVTIRASDSALASIRRPMCAIARPRTGAGTAAQLAWAFLADSAAPRKTDASARLTSADDLAGTRRVGAADRRRAGDRLTADDGGDRTDGAHLLLSSRWCWLCCSKTRLDRARHGGHGLVDLIVAHRQCRTEADRPLTAGQHDHVLAIVQVGDHRSRTVAVGQVDGQEQPTAAGIGDLIGMGGDDATPGRPGSVRP